MSGLAKIEVVNLRRLENGKLKAFADVLLDETYLVKGFRIAEGSEGLFVGFPQQNGKNGRWYDTFQAINDEAKKRLSEIVMAAYME